MLKLETSDRKNSTSTKLQRKEREVRGGAIKQKDDC